MNCKEIVEQLKSHSSEKYNEARIGTVKFLPPDYNLDILGKDYENIQTMIFKNVSSFQEIIDAIGLLESEINQL
ncbi:MAG: hypothetical protein RBQ94_02725 [Methanimicrococcus sp.]|nr:hypothetical protein [Methanimicrococcus sp.]